MIIITGEHTAIDIDGTDDTDGNEGNGELLDKSAEIAETDTEEVVKIRKAKLEEALDVSTLTKRRYLLLLLSQ